MNVIQHLWEWSPSLWVGTAITSAILFYLGRVAGQQTGYALQLVLHPLRLVRGWWLCPQCLDNVEAGICPFCFEPKHPNAKTRGSVRFTQLKAWDWIHWRSRTRYAFAPKR